jgi:hypothetical protein
MEKIKKSKEELRALVMVGLQGIPEASTIRSVAITSRGHVRPGEPNWEVTPVGSDPTHVLDQIVPQIQSVYDLAIP